MGLLLPIIWASFAGYGFWIAAIKRRHPAEGIFLGLFFGPVGCIVEASLRGRNPAETEEEQSPAEAEEERIRREAEAHAEDEEDRLLREAFRAEAASRREAARARAEASRARRRESYARLAHWLDRAILKFGWYKALPEFAQPIVIGLLIALPLVVAMILIFRGR